MTWTPADNLDAEVNCGYAIRAAAGSPRLAEDGTAFGATEVIP